MALAKRHSPAAYEEYVKGLYRNREKPDIDVTTVNGRLLKRRLESYKAISQLPKDFFARLLISQNGICASPVCQKDITSCYDIDHIMPLSLGGTDEPDNFQLLCSTCNRRKNNKHPDEWLRWLGVKS
jgi:5-methylcytosine-specific restriction endonuclease McrA